MVNLAACTLGEVVATRATVTRRGSMHTTPSRAAIRATGLRKSFGDKLVLDGIDLEVADGTVFALLGRCLHCLQATRTTLATPTEAITRSKLTEPTRDAVRLAP